MNKKVEEIKTIKMQYKELEISEPESEVCEFCNGTGIEETNDMYDSSRGELITFGTTRKCICKLENDTDNGLDDEEPETDTQTAFANIGSQMQTINELI